MRCSCVQTAVIKENENERLRVLIKKLENRVSGYQVELISVYEKMKKEKTYVNVAFSDY